MIEIGVLGPREVVGFGWTNDMTDINTYAADDIESCAQNGVFCTRYARYGDNGEPTQFPILHRVDAERPHEARFVGPVYELSPKQWERHETLENPYAVKAGNIATELQNECERAGRVLYPVYIETDADTEWSVFWSVAEDLLSYLQVDSEDCTCFYSGGRSPHIHVPLFVRDDDLRELRRRAKGISGRLLDAAVYGRKRQFRLPGVPHFKTRVPKYPIEWGCDRSTAAQGVSTPAPVYLSYDELLSDIVGEDWPSRTWRPRLVADGDIQDYVAEIIEKPRGEVEGIEYEIWKQYSEIPYSPYANAGDGELSVAIIDPTGPSFDGGTRVPGHVMAVGCDGKYRTDGFEGRPLKLSKADAAKWTDDTSHVYVIIGGKSRSSRILRIADEDFPSVRDALERDKQTALDYLDSAGYDIGQRGAAPGFECSNTRISSEPPSKWVQLQQEVERGDRQLWAISHDDRHALAWSLLEREGWGGAWEWFREQFGDRFNREKTLEYLGKCAVRKKQLDQSHLNIPDEVQRRWGG